MKMNVYDMGYEPSDLHVTISDLMVAAYFSPSWTAFQADGGRDFKVIVDGVSV